MGALKPVHVLVFLLIVLLLFGAKRLPDLARSVGQSLKILKTEVKDLSDDGTPAATATTAGGTPVLTTPAVATTPSPAPVTLPPTESKPPGLDADSGVPVAGTDTISGSEDTTPPKL